MEIASPLPIPRGRGGTKRAFVCSPFMDDDSNPFGSGSRVDAIDNFSSCGASITNTDMSCGNAFKRRRFTTDENMEEPFSGRLPLSTLPLQQQSSGTPSTKRARTETQHQSWNQAHAKEQIAIELQRVVDQQAAEIERLKAEKDAVQESFTKLKSDHDRITNENRILKKGITIQQERQNMAQNEIAAANRYKATAEERIRRLEQMNLTLRYHLQATQPSHGNDFMGFSPRPPDVC
mmetsp:Transcript_44685/g.54100  ORF Transcript_44685/g.54100 Transcript_44685/m.54100 type:complete len:235 (+) Transcript_44685:135-839(+)|eukprot:CAMPEP_0172497152 /NCGR_PEP_ID=MMETSP1066-20121228/96045_1 /TAXON_ID=671091 /ORGANISM="Coscinodiscus wailesii, Strain CCMP2513" /LENGTH=234 /DNA_ID=CAMNT_0013269771 /DNA_START=133 /DNA_END=837 /DNA_ORIENTATION=+